MKTMAATRKPAKNSFTSGSLSEKGRACTALPLTARGPGLGALRTGRLLSGNLSLIATFMSTQRSRYKIRRQCGVFRYLRCRLPEKILAIFQHLSGATQSPAWRTDAQADDGTGGRQAVFIVIQRADCRARNGYYRTQVFL